MKKLLAFTLLPLLLVGCKKPQNKFTVLTYCYSYQTSEVQDYTHDCRLAVFVDNEGKTCYVEVDYSYYEDTIKVKKTEKNITYRVYSFEEKVSNNGWELAND